MNSQKYLVLIKGEDKTEEIQNYKKDKLYIYINYKNSPTIYAYSRKNFEFYKDPIEIDINSNNVYLNQGYLYHITKILKFHRYYKIFFEDHSEILVEENNINIVQNNDKMVVSSNNFKYFNEISKIISVKTGEGIGLLTKYYENINFIQRGTALYKYITPLDGIRTLVCESLDDLIFPFGANKSQFEAVRNAMNHEISIIEGPPRNRKNTDNIKYYSKYY